LEDYSASCPLDEGFRNRSDTAEFVHVECQPSVQSQETDSMKAISKCVKPGHKSVNLVYLSPTFPLSESFLGMPGRAEVFQLQLQQQVN
jgi:hypothetical protein